MSVWITDNWQLLRELPFHLYHGWEAEFSENDERQCFTELDKWLWREKKILIKFHYQHKCTGGDKRHPKFRFNAVEKCEKVEYQEKCYCSKYRLGRKKQLKYDFIRECNMEHQSYIQLESFKCIGGLTMMLLRGKENPIMSWCFSSVSRDGFVSSRAAVSALYNEFGPTCTCGIHSEISPWQAQMMFPAVKPWKLVQDIGRIDSRNLYNTLQTMHYYSIKFNVYADSFRRLMFGEVPEEDSDEEPYEEDDLTEQERLELMFFESRSDTNIAVHREVMFKYKRFIMRPQSYPFCIESFDDCRYSSSHDYLTFPFF